MTKNDCSICDKIARVVRSTGLDQISLGSGKTALELTMGCTAHQRLLASALSLDSLPDSDRQLEILEAIRDIRVVKIPHHGGAILVADLSSPDFAITQPKRAALYLSKTLDDPDDLVGGRIVDPEWINSGLPLFWKESCARLHGDSCRNFSISSLPTAKPALLVDVYEQRIVENSGSYSYVALSYVWGGQQSLLATEANIAILQQPYSLAESALGHLMSRTTRDALGIVKLLGERYLWVDTLCIVQDRGIQKHEELSKMGGIYANSSVTILAIQGEHANSGLRGFNGISEPRNLQQVVHYLADGTKILQLPAEGNHHDVECSHSIWSTRAWTYQEKQCSIRKLIFDGDSLRWECMESVWREHVDSTAPLDTFLSGVTAYHFMLRASIPAFSEFQEVLTEYNCRVFSYPEDATDAFTGICHGISTAVGGKLITGLPATCFDVFLLWSPKTRVSRRLPIDPDRACSLPSWSWVGWSGAISINIGSAENFLKKSTSKAYRLANSHILTPLVTWMYHETPNSSGSPIEPDILKSRESWLNSELNLGSEWSVHDISESPELKRDLERLNYTPVSFFKNKKYPDYEFRYPIPILKAESKPVIMNPPFISCSTRRAYLFPGERIHKFYGKAPIFSLRDETGQWAGALEPLVRISASADLVEMKEHESLEVVEIARGCCPKTTASETGIEELDHPERPSAPDDGWYHFYWVMWIEWEQGIAYRKGIGRVCSTVWEMQIREDVKLMLG